MRCLLCLIMALVIFCFGGISAQASLPYYGEFSYWYSDAGSIGYFAHQSNTVGYAIEPEVGMSSSEIFAYTVHALQAWPLSSYYSLVPYHDADLKIHCITRAKADALQIPDNVAGVNAWVDEYLTSYGTYAGRTIYIYAIPRYLTLLIWCDETAEFSDVLWRSVSAHEHGHGLGYAGHNKTDSTQLMYHLLTGVQTAKIQVKRHMRSMYVID